MKENIKGYLAIETGALKALGLVRIVNSVTNGCVCTCAPDEADAVREKLPPAVDDRPNITSTATKRGGTTTDGKKSSVASVALAGAVGEDVGTKKRGTTKSQTGGATSKQTASSTGGAKTSASAPKVSNENGAETKTDTDNLSFSSLITALLNEYKASHENEVWRVPVECVVAEHGVIKNSLNNPTDRKTRTLSDEEIAMLVFTPDGEIHLRKEYEHSDGTIATVDKEGLNFTFDMEKVVEGEKSDNFPLMLLRKGGGKALLKAWHVQDPATYADPKRAIVYDIETTGVKADAEVLQLTVMDFEGNAIFNDYFKPEYTTDWSDASAVNGITADVVACKKTFRSRLPEIQEIFDRATLICGYNSVHFDDNVLKTSGITFKPDVPHYDVMVHYQKVFGMHGLEWCGKGNTYLMQKLTLAYADCIGTREGAKDTVLGAHDALSDTRMTLEIFKALQTNDLTRDTPHWISLFIRECVRNKGKAFGSQYEATKLWTDLFYQDQPSRVQSIRDIAGTKGFGAVPKVWDLSRFCK